MKDIVTESTKKLLDAIDRGNKECRTCKHARYLHKELKRCLLTYAVTPKKYKLCDCEEFVPLDNLDYVEWLAKKRGL